MDGPDGHLRRLHQLSRASRGRIRRALRNAQRAQLSSSSSDEEAPPQHRNVAVPVAAHEEPSSESDTSAAEDVHNHRINAAMEDGDNDNERDMHPERNDPHPLNVENDSSNDESANSQHAIEDSDNGPEGVEEVAGAIDFHDEDYVDYDLQEDNQQHQEHNNWGHNNNLPIYDLAPITLSESMYSVFSFFLRHNLSLSCLSDLLGLINLHCRQEGNCFPTTLYNFKKYFHNIQFPIVRRHYCSVCSHILARENEICQNCNATSTEYFVEIPVVPQLRALYNRPGFVDKLNYRFQRRKDVALNYEDIYDGAVYRELCLDDGILSDPRNISLMWYTDGVSLFGSSRYEIWPFYFVINELPYNDRTKVSNALLAGLWFGKKPPVATTFLNYIRYDLLHLKNGVDIAYGNPQQIRTVKGIVICGTADLPAKAKFLNMKGHSSYYGCSKCKILTRCLRPGVFVYPFRLNLELRSTQETLRHAQEAVRLPLYNGQREDRFGVKGPSILSTFVHDYVRTTAVDVMHCAFINLPKCLLHFWFDSKFVDYGFSLRNHKTIINLRLSKINPPNFVQRLTRTLDDTKYWRAHEYKAFIFYYSLPVLSDKMNDIYLEHHKLLVLGLYLLNQRSVSNAMVELASVLLSEYVSQFEALYGIEAMTCNLHQLLHLPKIVQDLGPSWVTSCFPFEDLNGKLKKLVKGSRHAELQICSGVAMLMKFSELKVNVPHGRARDYAERLFDPNRSLCLTNIGHRLAIVGNPRRIVQPPAHVLESLDRAQIEGRSYYEFYRLLKYCVIYGSQLYARNVKTISYCVKFNSEGNNFIGFINRFIIVMNCDCAGLCLNCNPRFVAIIQKCETSLDFKVLEDYDLPFIHTLQIHGQYIAVDVSNIISMCFSVSIRDQNVTYLIEPVNLIEPE